MKLWCAIPWLAGAFLAMTPRDEGFVVLLAGDSQGLLTPCGCTQPMSGGMRRKASAIRGLWKPGQTLYLENGGLIGGGGRQSQLKLEAQADLLAQLRVSAVHVTRSDLASGPDAAITLQNLLRERLLGDSATNDLFQGIEAFHSEGPFLIAGGANQADAQRLADEAVTRNLTSVLLLDGSFEMASSLARDLPSTGLIQYRAGGQPHSAWVGNTLLVTPGDRGKAIVRLDYNHGVFSGFQAINLGPEHADDPTAAKVFRTYLDRVGDEGLAEKLPRSPALNFVGTAVCAKCHAKSAAIWSRSAHFHALGSLRAIGEQFDPECLRCHVVGLDSTTGYRAGSAARNLGSVGCQSCHGPGKEHARTPIRMALKPVLQSSCLNCHTSDQSPNFRFESYWAKVKH